MNLQGLILAGGKSKRMGHDKALLKYNDNKTQLAHAFQAVGIHTENTFVSIAEDQLDDNERNKFPLIVDHYKQIGPLGGILSAFAELPESSLVVVACDLPFISQENVAYLIEQRDPTKQATAYKGFKDGPEPLFCIYEHSALEALKNQLSQEHACPRKALYQMEIKLVDPLNPKDIQNINCPEDLAKLLLHSEQEQTYHIQFYAGLKEQAGRGKTSFSSNALTPLSLYAALQETYNLKTSIGSVKVAINDELKDLDTQLEDGDHICFFPLLPEANMNFTITDNTIDHEALRNSLSDSKAGAVNIFEGIVRNHHEGKAVASLHYEAHEALAQKERAAILRESADKFEVIRIVAAHRVGHLAIGELAVWVGVSSAHRAEAYDASRYVIEEIKKRLPIWKKEFWEDGEHHWVGDTKA